MTSWGKQIYKQLLLLLCLEYFNIITIKEICMKIIFIWSEVLFIAFFKVLSPLVCLASQLGIRFWTLSYTSSWIFVSFPSIASSYIYNLSCISVKGTSSPEEVHSGLMHSFLICSYTRQKITPGFKKKKNLSRSGWVRRTFAATGKHMRWDSQTLARLPPVKHMHILADCSKLRPGSVGQSQTCLPSYLHVLEESIEAGECGFYRAISVSASTTESFPKRRKFILLGDQST